MERSQSLIIEERVECLILWRLAILGVSDRLDLRCLLFGQKDPKIGEH